MSLFNFDVSDPIPSKTCRDCGQRKPLDHFRGDKRKPGYLNPACRECRTKKRNKPKVQTRFRREKRCARCKEVQPIENFREVLANRDGRYSWCRKCQRQSNTGYSRKHKYDISHEQYVAMLESQEGKCKICGHSDTGSPRHKEMFVDHCHASGRVRGLLCFPCNSAIGHFRDDVEILQKAIDYLESFKE